MVSPLKIELEDTGEVFSAVTDFELTEDWFSPSETWEATVDGTDPIALRRKLQPLTRVRLYIHENLQLVGRIDHTSGTGGRGLKISGHDYIQQLVEASIDDSLRITGDMTLETALLQGLRPFGITEIETSVQDVRAKKMGSVTYQEVDQDLAIKKYRDSFDIGTQAFIDALKPYKKTVAVAEKVDSAKPNEGEGVHAWGTRICARSGFAMRPGSKRGSVAVVAPDYSTQARFALSRPFSIDDKPSGFGNVENGIAERDWSIPSVVKMRSKSETTGLKTKDENTQLSPGDDTEPFSQIPECKRIMDAANFGKEYVRVGTTGDPKNWYVPVFYRDGESKSAEKLTAATRRFAAEEMRKTLGYTCHVKGFDFDGVLWAINNLSTVADGIEDVNEVLWVHRRSFSFGDGERTNLSLIRPSSYVL